MDYELWEDNLNSLPKTPFLLEFFFYHKQLHNKQFKNINILIGTKTLANLVELGLVILQTKLTKLTNYVETD